MNKYHQVPALIDVSESTTVSLAASILGWRVVGLAFPATLTGTAFTFQVDPGDGTFRPVSKEDDTALGLSNVDASDLILLPTAYALVGVNVKVVSGSAEGGDRTIILLCVPAGAD